MTHLYLSAEILLPTDSPLPEIFTCSRMYVCMVFQVLFRLQWFRISLNISSRRFKGVLLHNNKWVKFGKRGAVLFDVCIWGVVGWWKGRGIKSRRAIEERVYKTNLTCLDLPVLYFLRISQDYHTIEFVSSPSNLLPFTSVFAISLHQSYFRKISLGFNNTTANIASSSVSLF